MVAFDFITDDQFRISLESDDRELNAAMESKSWKSVHVLAGSIIEAVLVDYLTAISYQDPKGRDVLELGLAQIITACKTEGILTQRAEDLSNVVRGYRNLIHPGRVKRLEETIDEEGATVAKTLVEIIIREVAKKRDEVYGPTAEQIVANLESDSSRIALLDNMLRKVRVHEQRRLLLDVIPGRYFERETSHWNQFSLLQMEALEFEDLDQTGIERAFRFALDSAPEEIKRAVVSKFIWILENEIEDRRVTYERAFFKASDLKYTSQENIDKVKAHIFLVLSQNPSQIINSLSGIGEFLATEEEAVQLVDGVIKSRHKWNKEGIVDYLQSELPNMEPKTRSASCRRLNDWVTALERNKSTQKIAEQLKVTAYTYDDDIPF